jgi:hypothetical protein
MKYKIIERIIYALPLTQFWVYKRFHTSKIKYKKKEIKK